MLDEHLNLNDKLKQFKGDIVNSKKYWIITLILILVSFFAVMGVIDYSHPKMEIAVLIISSILSIFFISFYHGHNDDKNFYKTVFLIIFIVGIVFSFLTPIMCAPDEVEHFVRAEMTSGGIIIPEYNETPFTLDGVTHKGYYLTIQSTLDLIERGKHVNFNGYNDMRMVNSTILKTNADTEPINYTPAKFHSCFIQNPFYGYIAPAIGMAIAKLFSLNAIWMLWLGRVFNSLLYAGLVSYAIKKTPILKVPLFVVACIPAALSQAATVGVDPIINGLGILSIAYFLMLYKSPDNSLDYKPIIKFSIIVLLMGLCKVTYFSFIFLLLLVPSAKFKEKKYSYYRFLSIIVLLGILALWSKFWVNTAVHNSYRNVYYTVYNVDTAKQISYILSHKKDTIITVLHLVDNLERDLKCNLYIGGQFSELFLLFMGAVYLFYPQEKIDLKTRIGVFLVFVMVYLGTYIVFMVTWNPVGVLPPEGVQPRYFFPALGLIPIFLGINHMKGDTSEIDYYLVMLTILFIVVRIFRITVIAY